MALALECRGGVGMDGQIEFELDLPKLPKELTGLLQTRATATIKETLAVVNRCVRQNMAAPLKS